MFISVVVLLTMCHMNQQAWERWSESQATSMTTQPLVLSSLFQRQEEIAILGVKGVVVEAVTEDPRK